MPEQTCAHAAKICDSQCDALRGITFPRDQMEPITLCVSSSGYIALQDSGSVYKKMLDGFGLRTLHTPLIQSPGLPVVC